MGAEVVSHSQYNEENNRMLCPGPGLQSPWYALGGKMLGLLAALAVLSVLILVGFVFRPTPIQVATRANVLEDRQSDRFAVLGAFPSREAAEDYEDLQSRAAREGVTIDWEKARQDQAASPDPKPSLTGAALHQL